MIALFDPRRTMVGAVPDAYFGGYADGAARAGALAVSVADELARRSEPQGPTTTASASASGPTTPSPPRVVVLVDDYDVLDAGGSDLLAPLRPYLANGRDLGLHMVLTRRVAGAGRGLFDRTVIALREAGGTALVMSGDRAEGQLVNGVRAAAQPPGRAILTRPGRPPVTVQLAMPGSAAAALVQVRRGA